MIYQDLVRIALSAMIPILSAYGNNVSNLPTAIVSNTLDYGLFKILDTTEYMSETIEVWNKLDFHFDCICTGFINQMKQIDIIEKIVNDNPNAFILVDPIMGDDGKLYNGIKSEIISDMRRLVPMADVLIPNLTEAELLVHGKTQSQNYCDEYFRDLLFKLQGMGAKSVVISSVLNNGKYYLYGIEQNEVFQIEYQYIDVRFPGTGDVFSAIIVGNLLKQASLRDAVKQASDFVYRAIEMNCQSKDNRQGLKVEQLIRKIIK